MDEINKLENKYLVLKCEDIQTALNEDDFETFANIVQKVDVYRRQSLNKGPNSYVVLNINDKIDHQKLIVDLEAIDAHTPQTVLLKVGDIATTIVNALLKKVK